MTRDLDDASILWIHAQRVCAHHSVMHTEPLLLAKTYLHILHGVQALQLLHRVQQRRPPLHLCIQTDLLQRGV